MPLNNPVKIFNFGIFISEKILNKVSFLSLVYPIYTFDLVFSFYSFEASARKKAETNKESIILLNSLSSTGADNFLKYISFKKGKQFENQIKQRHE